MSRRTSRLNRYGRRRGLLPDATGSVAASTVAWSTTGHHGSSDLLAIGWRVELGNDPPARVITPIRSARAKTSSRSSLISRIAAFRARAAIQLRVNGAGGAGVEPATWAMRDDDARRIAEPSRAITSYEAAFPPVPAALPSAPGSDSLARRNRRSPSRYQRTPIGLQVRMRSAHRHSGRCRLLRATKLSLTGNALASACCGVTISRPA